MKIPLIILIFECCDTSKIPHPKLEIFNCSANQSVDLNNLYSIEILGQTSRSKSAIDCVFIILPYTGLDLNCLWFYLNIFSLSNRLSDGVEANLTIYNSIGVIYEKILRKKTDSVDFVQLYEEFIKKNVKFTHSISIRLLASEGVSLILSLQVTVVMYCFPMENTKFFCLETFNKTDVCISSQLVCNGYSDCLLTDVDERSGLCHQNMYMHIMIPIVIVITMLIIMAWMIFKIIPCLFRNEEQVSPNQSHPLMHRAFNFLNPPATVTSIHTPDFMTPSPPPYRNSDKTEYSNITCAKYPPTYSDTEALGVRPSFFKRFFGDFKSANNIDRGNQESTNQPSIKTKSNDQLADIPNPAPILIP